MDWDNIEISNVIGPYEGDLKLGVPIRVNVIVRFRVDNTENKTLVLIRDQEFLEFGVTAPVIGASKMYQLEEAMGALEVSLSSEECAFLEELYWPRALLVHQ